MTERHNLRWKRKDNGDHAATYMGREIVCRPETSHDWVLMLDGKQVAGASSLHMVRVIAERMPSHDWHANPAMNEAMASGEIP